MSGTNKNQYDFVNIGSRIQEARNLAFNSRQEFSRISGIPYISLFTWETGQKKIRERSIDTFLEGLKKSNVLCSKEWILTGKGIAPFKTENKEFSHAISNLSQFEDALGIKLDLYSLFNRHAEAVSLPMTDDRFNPYFFKGDVLFGKILSVEKFNKNKRAYYLIETRKNVYSPCFLEKNDDESFNYISMEKRIEDRAIEKNIRLEFVIPIISVFYDY